ncbi:MAG: hypothetical protein ACKO46_05130, partial [Alphaproteobacteria bacterium]
IYSAVSNVLKVFASAVSKISETIKETWFRTDGDRFLDRLKAEEIIQRREERKEGKPGPNPANPQGRQLDAIVERRGR